MSAAFRKTQSSIAVLLLVATLVFFIPALQPARAQLDITSCFSSILGFFGIDISSIGGALGSLGIGIGLEVPVRDAVVRAQTTIANTSTNNSSCVNVFTTAILKTAIALVRDMVLRWIVTGNFGAPVFSTSYRIDATRIAENASRIFISQLTGLNFCAGFGIPSPQNFLLGFALTSQCTLPAGINENYTDALLRLHNDPGSLTFEEYLALSNPQNNRVYQYVWALDEKRRQEAIAVNSFNQEYQAGKGFFCVRNASGRCVTPGSAVAELVMQSQIVSPIRQTDVADDIQTAIAAILDTAVRVLIERGLATVFGP